MKVEVNHTTGFHFETKIRDHVFSMDTQVSQGGTNKGPSPKELMLAGIVGCTAMDIIALLKKHGMTPESLTVSGDAEPRQSHPRVFTGVEVVFEVRGKDLTADKVTEAARLSLTKFCGVSAMVSKVVPIHYKVMLNGALAGRGDAEFDV
jgi:putative redox protein